MARAWVFDESLWALLGRLCALAVMLFALAWLGRRFPVVSIVLHPATLIALAVVLAILSRRRVA